MSPIVLVLYATFLINLLLSAAGAVIGVLALYRAWTAPANAYEFAGKRPKNTWLALTGVSAVVQVLGVFSAFTGAGNTMLRVPGRRVARSGWPPLLGGFQRSIRAHLVAVASAYGEPRIPRSGTISGRGVWGFLPAKRCIRQVFGRTRIFCPRRHDKPAGK